MPRNRKTVQRRKRRNLLRTRSLRRKTRRIRGGYGEIDKIQKIDAEDFEPYFLKEKEPYRRIRYSESSPYTIMYGRKRESLGFEKPDDFDTETRITVKEDNDLLYADNPGLTFTRVKFNESEQTFEPFDETYEQFEKTKINL